MLSQPVAGGIEATWYDSTIWKLASDWFPLACALGPFPSLFPLPGVSPSHEPNYMLSPASSPSESPDLAMVYATPDPGSNPDSATSKLSNPGQPIYLLGHFLIFNLGKKKKNSFILLHLGKELNKLKYVKSLE